MDADVAATTALILFAVFGGLGFAWRSWEQRRRTGSTGFRGISGSVCSAEWFAGVGFVARANNSRILAAMWSTNCSSWLRTLPPLPIWLDAKTFTYFSASCLNKCATSRIIEV